MEAVRRYRYVEQFFLPWSLDYRGRGYPIPAYLTPQDTDFGKSLLRFSKESMMTFEGEDWLRFQVATTYGLDKKTMKERIDWTWDNESLITRIVLNPLDTIHEWEVADEPWQFLAACEEYYYCIISGERNYTGLPIATDATCSGIPYNAKFKSNWGYVKEALIEKGLNPEKEDITLITHALRDACFELFPGPKAVMDWVNEEVTKAIKRGDREIQWVTPSGFVATQKFMKKEFKQLDLKLMGRVRVNVATGDRKRL